MRRALTLGVIGVVGYVLARMVNLAAERVARTHGENDHERNLRARTLYTQVAVLRRVALLVIGFVSLAAVLMVFAAVRQLGASLLASAGVLGIVAGVASQRSLADLVAGFRIALTQPILPDDAVKVEGEFGTVEEITLTYVVVRLWDLRRLVLPISYFLEKPFQKRLREASVGSCGFGHRVQLARRRRHLVSPPERGFPSRRGQIPRERLRQTKLSRP